MTTLRAGLVAVLALAVGACSDPVTPIPPTDALSARGGIPGPNNREPYFLFYDEETGEDLTDCSGTCYFTIANVAPRASITATRVLRGTELGECWTGIWDDDGNTADGIPWSNLWTWSQTITFRADASRIVTASIYDPKYPAVGEYSDTYAPCPPESPVLDIYREYTDNSTLTVVITAPNRRTDTLTIFDNFR